MLAISVDIDTHNSVVHQWYIVDTNNSVESQWYQMYVISVDINNSVVCQWYHNINASVDTCTNWHHDVFHISRY